MYNELVAKGKTWVLNQPMDFLGEGYGKLTEIWEDDTNIGIEVAMNSGGEIFVARIPIVNKQIDEYETVPSSD